MKTRFFSAIKPILADRQLLGFLIAIAGFSLLYVLYVVLSLRPTDVQVATHYSAFGDTHYYRNKWYYVLTFAVFGLVFAVAHIGIILKLIKEDFRSLAIAFAWLSLMLLIVAFILTHSILSIAFLS